jgi:hypothetical protein
LAVNLGGEGGLSQAGADRCGYCFDRDRFVEGPDRAVRQSYVDHGVLLAKKSAVEAALFSAA